jgi:hypothetical protein
MEMNASTAFIPLYRRNQGNQRDNVNCQQTVMKIQPADRKCYPDQQCYCHNGLFEKAIRPWLWLEILGDPPEKHAVNGFFALNIMWTMRTKELKYDNRKNK